MGQFLFPILLEVFQTYQLFISWTTRTNFLFPISLKVFTLCLNQSAQPKPIQIFYKPALLFQNMGLIRGGLFTIVATIFFIGLLTIGLLVTINHSLEYKNVQENLGDALMEQVNEQIDLNQTLENISIQAEIYCQDNSEISFNSEELPVEINLSCESIDNGEEEILSELINESIEQIYYQDYDCGLTECIDDEQKVFFFFSQDFKEYVESKFYYVFGILIILFILMLLLAENKSNAFVVTGILMAVVSLPFMKLNSFFGFLDGYLKILFQIFFSKSYSAFIRLFIFGIIFLTLGLIFKFTSLGIKFTEFINKFKKDKSKQAPITKKETTFKTKKPKKKT